MQIKITPNESKKDPSTEEQFLIDFFESKSIKFEFEKYRLNNLIGDEKNYRVPDFYLTKYKIYVEYFGLYNSTKEIRAAYDYKAKLYINNHIPTIILYPHELGIIEYIFHKRMIKVLKLDKFQFKPQLKRYKLLRFLEKTTNGNFAVLFISFCLMFGLLNIKTGLNKEFLVMLFIGSSMVFIWAFIMIFVDFWRYFIKEE
jgi:hypothetical protein